jgi:hypothetical protein
MQIAGKGLSLPAIWLRETPHKDGVLSALIISAIGG